ncbi:ribonuclease III family protein [Actinidia rufa]|uniref:Ribonuclease III family protein n=1 Tax=Actinidia rufa TaxID=165716 RepID=A0A7J0G096_9ERIC|nr:ribonuclease III family protein [Actinidia rufa]
MGMVMIQGEGGGEVEFWCLGAARVGSRWSSKEWELEDFENLKLATGKFEETYLGYEAWLPTPPKVEKPRSIYNAASLAYIGDSIYEVASWGEPSKPPTDPVHRWNFNGTLYARRHFLFPPLNIEEYNDRVMAVVRCEAQDAMLQKLLNEKCLSEEERLTEMDDTQGNGKGSGNENFQMTELGIWEFNSSRGKTQQGKTGKTQQGKTLEYRGLTEETVIPMESVAVVRQFLKLKPPTFKGGMDPVKANDWILTMEKNFRLLRCGEQQKVKIGSYLLAGKLVGGGISREIEVRNEIRCFHCNEVRHIKRNCARVRTEVASPRGGPVGGNARPAENARPGGNRPGNPENRGENVNNQRQGQAFALMPGIARNTENVVAGTPGKSLGNSQTIGMSPTDESFDKDNITLHKYP